MSELADKVEEIFATVEDLHEVAGDGPATRKLLDSLFRTAHSLKAAATTNGLSNVATAAHEFENLLYLLRTGKTALNHDAFQTLNDSAETLSKSLTDEKPSSTPIPAEIWNTLKEDERHTLKQSVAEGATLFLVQTSFDVAGFDRQFQSLKEALSRSGEVISTAPKIDSERPDKINFRILYAKTAGQPSVDLSELAGVSAEEIVIPMPPPSAVVRKRSAPESVRIGLEELDRIISSTHKLYRQITDADAVERGLLDLSTELVNLRMVPVERILQRALRAGRSAAAAIGKEVEFELRGQNLLLDKSLSEAIADPLVHLVRNAVDHGIENNDDRVKLGKARNGKIVIEAAALQGQTRIAVRDDGRGIDPAIVEKAAKRLGVVDADAIVNTERSIRLLFRAGFSTAPHVSQISGRGVGLDVVETGVEEVGGSIRVSSQLGEGSTFEIRLPVTFGLLEVVTVTVGGRRYLIDASHVIAESATDLKAVRMSSLLGQQDNQEQATLHCQFVNQGSEKTEVALAVDEIGETQPVLIRGLGSRSSRWFGVAGAGELRDGSVVLLLDLPRLVSRSLDPLYQK